MLTHSSLSSPAIVHGFFGRRGGVSAGIFDSLNCGFGSSDDATRVAENRRRALRKLGMADRPLVTIHQIHSGQAQIADVLWDSPKVVQGDGLVTRRSNLVIGILTADCTPVLFHDPDNGVIGAAHAGWRGAIGGILESTLDEMEGLGGDRARIKAVIGPTIGWDSYEVSDDFKTEFLTQDSQSDAFFKPGQKPGHPFFNLPGYVEARLNRLGLASVADLGVDTLTNPGQYFSYRASQRAGQDDYGRNLSVIALTDGD